MSLSLKNRIAVVTGSGKGIGLGIARRLAAKGATVIISDIIDEIAQTAVKEIEAEGGKASCILADVSKRDESKFLIDETIKRYGDIHILVNNAGINRDSLIHKMSFEAWEQVIAVNLTGVFNCLQFAVIHMREKEYGRVINISSAGWQGNIGQANYAAAKAGVIGLTKTAAKELAKKRVTVNAICPGFIKTDMTLGIPEKAWDIMINKIPMGYAGKPDDIGNMVAFLASDEAAYITSEIINVGGGMVL